MLKSHNKVSEMLITRYIIVALLLLALLAACSGNDKTPSVIPNASITPAIGECIVGPYLQTTTPTSIRIMWGAVGAGDSWVEWEPEPGNKTDGYEDIVIKTLGIVQEFEEIFPRAYPDSVIHNSQLTGLVPDTRYYYRVIAEGQVCSDIYSFTTSPMEDSEKTFTFVVYADDQRSPEQHTQVIDGMSAYLPDQPTMVWIVGDTVEDGPNYDGFKNEYFDPIQPLCYQAPFYTAIGNHKYLYYPESPLIYRNEERNGEIYFAYADLPGNEHNYSFNYSNCHFVALDANGPLFDECNYGAGFEAQLEWLESDFLKASANPNIDFIFAFHHEPYKTALWNQSHGGCTPCVGEFIDLYERYGVNAFFHGHTHAMERGNSQEAPVYWLDSSGGGAPLANWLGPDTSSAVCFDWPEIQMAVDEHGFHVITVTAGDNPQFNIRYISLGDLYSEVREGPHTIDDLTFIPNNTRPEKPVCLYPSITDTPSPKNIGFEASSFSDPDKDDYHHESHWQVTMVSGEYPPATEPAELYPPSLPEPTLPFIADRWIRYENIYGETSDGTSINMQPNDGLTNETISLDPDTTYFWRVRCRDGLGLAGSEWSDEATFTTALE